MLTTRLLHSIIGSLELCTLSLFKATLYPNNLSPLPSMLFFVARPRLALFALLSVLPVVNSKDESLCKSRSCKFCYMSLSMYLTAVTSSITYCAPPETLLIQQFDVAYFAKNSSILFNISAASVVSCPLVRKSFLAHHLVSRHPISTFLPISSSMSTACTP